ncbi:histone deacetylase family protein [Paracoccus rhizosphaerae]|uniref:Histone deacetylase family protein n=1 Tax=Paracoccus rhizosphaerae TaxID=1133347 RepID=A0ABV6CMP7_9RHOB|nr:histone deacetylase family protein [Paracoccus rhizosphaerae]
MKAIFDPRQLEHGPETYFRRGAEMPHPEQPRRAILIRDMLQENGFPVEAPRDFGLDPIRAVHDPDYVEFFRDAHARFRADAPPDALAIPTTHPGPRRGRCPADIHGAMGWWMTDTSTPLTEGTWDAIYWSAQSAIEAAEHVVNGEPMVYALSRPPGHHAMAAAANGFCFFNNACIAAHHLTRRWKKVALLDIDVHTGNGSLDILYERGDILFISLHPDPAGYPTFFLGHEDETGEGEGAGTCRNLLLPMGASQDVVLEALDQALEMIRDFGTEALIVSLGFDMAADDPLAAVGVHPDGFAEMGRRITALGLPTVLVQEGGYLGPSLAQNACSFLTACREEL